MDILSLLPILLIFVVIYFFMIKPAKKRQQEAVQTQNSLRPGSEVRTVAGLFATVSEVEDDSVILEIAPDVHCRYLKSAIVAVLSTGDDDEGHDGAEDDHGDDHGDEDDHGARGANDDDGVALDKKPERGASRDDGEQPG
ncbi:preprotein translocase subunit YajC [Yinghuangia sp. ASG 101]|uniref:preprotein translocase subunit YajC n=1 Tax=Yinghuangia sp. ASG 101 TaxID=2896848 RepID=UPI001E601EA8|nr:preprotein translocase subunit YajC [Yinghuangia sp. ASG 101]UGQ10659.1 preprotein translocase subunit YajC [Yinghuangia sp. ASG 101]